MSIVLKISFSGFQLFSPSFDGMHRLHRIKQIFSSIVDNIAGKKTSSITKLLVSGLDMIHNEKTVIRPYASSQDLTPKFTLYSIQ